jgi:pimeloyl-ACP methyl ester carboxylesterase
MPGRILIALIALAVVSICVPVAHAAARTESETFRIDAADPGIQLQIRNRHPAGETRFVPDRVVLFVHGATYPVASAFDVELPGGSWMDYIAQRGFDVYAVDVRGYGGSTRPAVMDGDPKAGQPVAVTRDAVRDVTAAVNFIFKRRGVTKLNVVGWSWGTTTMATFAAENPEKVQRLVLFAPVWLPMRPPQYTGAYRTVTHDSARVSYTNGIPKDRVEEISPSAWYETWWAATQATDPGGASRNPPVLRAPNGVMKDFAELWGVGKPVYDPAAIKAATLLIVGEWDMTTPPAMAQALFPMLTGARNRRLVILSEGTHQMSLEKHRLRLIREVQHFLEEPLDR